MNIYIVRPHETRSVNFCCERSAKINRGSFATVEALVPWWEQSSSHHRYTQSSYHQRIYLAVMSSTGLIGLSEASIFACCSAKSFAARLFAAGPFKDLQQLLISARECWWHEMTVMDWLEAFDAHPKIGESAHSKPAAFAAYSSSEQAAAETSSFGDVQIELRQLNATYLARFGHIFIICASGRSAPEILQVLRQRCKCMPHEELATAATEQMAITELRLCKLWAEACAGGR